MIREMTDDLRDGFRRGLSLLNEAAVARGGRACPESPPAVPKPSFARGTPLRGLVDRHAAATGIDSLRLRSDVALAAAVETVVGHCGDRWRDVLLGGRLTRRRILELSRTHADRQRFRVAAVSAGLPLNPKPTWGPPTFETVGWHEVPSRLARAAGLMRGAAAALESAGRSVREADGFRDRLEAIGGVAVALRRFLEPLAGRPETPVAAFDSRACDPGKVGMRLAQVRGLAEKNLRDLPRLVRESGVDRDEAERSIRYLAALEADAAEALSRLGPTRMPGNPRPLPRPAADRRLATHRKPDVDALVACWLAERYLFPGDPVEVVFVPRGYVPPAGCPYDGVLDVGRRHDTARLHFDHKPPAVADRHSTCATKLLWEHLRSSGRDVGRLAGLVDLVRDGDSSRRRPGSVAYRESLADGVHAEVARLRDGSTDAMLYAATRLWLDRRYLVIDGRPEVGLSPGPEARSRTRRGGPAAVSGDAGRDGACRARPPRPTRTR